MPSPLTLAEVRDRLYKFVLPSDDPLNPDFLPYLNDVRERFFNSGKWNNMTGAVDFPSSTGYIALPHRYESIQAVQIHNIPRPIEGRYYEWMQGGWGNLDTDSGLGFLIDDGMSPVEVDITTAGTLRFAISAADVAAYPTENIRVFGLDENGDVIYDTSGNLGINVTMNAVTVNTTHTFSKVTGITKRTTKGAVTVSVVVSSVATELAVLEPSVTTAGFHRYKLGTVTADDAYPDAIRCLCKLRYTKLVSETDLVLPSNMGALKFGLMALAFEDQNDLDQALKHWNIAYALLNDEKKEARGGAKINVRFSPNGGLPKTYALR